MSHLAQFVYAEGQRPARLKSHILRFGDSPNEPCTALCGSHTLSGLWLGTGSQDEIDMALSLTPHARCVKIALEIDYDLGPHNPPQPDPFSFTIISADGEVDLIAVQRVLGGQRCQVTLAERRYIINQLIKEIDANPPEKSRSFREGWDPRVNLVSFGLNVTPREVSRMVQDRRKVLNRRRERDGVAA